MAQHDKVAHDGDVQQLLAFHHRCLCPAGDHHPTTNSNARIRLFYAGDNGFSNDRAAKSAPTVKIARFT